MRASSDIVHTDMMTQMRNTEIERPVTQQIVERLYSMVLTPQYIADRPEWNFAPVAVCGNAERCLINLQQAVRFANHYQQKIIQWRCELVGIATSLPTHAIDFIYENNTTTLTFTFLVGSPGFLTESINVLKGVVNGTQIKLHSLLWTCATVNAQIHQLISQSQDSDNATNPS
jgi:hypothetical protein